MVYGGACQRQPAGPIMVEALASNAIAQVGTISVPEPRMLSVQVWDKGQVALVEKPFAVRIGAEPDG